MRDDDYFDADTTKEVRAKLVATAKKYAMIPIDEKRRGWGVPTLAEINRLGRDDSVSNDHRGLRSRLKALKKSTYGSVAELREQLAEALIPQGIAQAA